MSVARCWASSTEQLDLARWSSMRVSRGRRLAAFSGGVRREGVFAGGGPRDISVAGIENSAWRNIG